jgi:hypothetical protein
VLRESRSHVHLRGNVACQTATPRSRTGFIARLQSFGTSIAALVAQYTALVRLVAPASVPRVVANDADDDHVIAAAVSARAE